MASFLKEFLGQHPHDLDQIRSSLDEAVAQRPDFISLMNKHHRYLEESITVLMDKDSSEGALQDHLYRFFRLVEMHGKAEEETLYVELRQNPSKEARLGGWGAQDEHDLAFQLESELLSMGYQYNWSEEIAAKAKVVAGLVRNHIKEEESVIFPLADEHISEAMLQSLCESYIEKCKIYLDESKRTTRQHPVSRLQPHSQDLHGAVLS